MTVKSPFGMLNGVFVITRAVARKKPTIREKCPHHLRLPKDSVSPTASVYKQFDIVSQGRVLWTIVDNPRMVRSAEPFVLRVSVHDKIREIKSKLEISKPKKG